MREFDGRVAVITGAASGIGRALADRFGTEGMRLVVADVERGPLSQAADELERAGADVLAVPTDVSSPADVEALARAAYERFGAVHVLCNNAGVGSFEGATLWEQPLGEFEWVLGVNLWGVLYGVRAFVPRMIDAGETGHIVNTASMSGLSSLPGNGAYQMSKHAVVTLTETLFFELAQRQARIGVSVLCPAYVATQITNAQRNRPAHLSSAPATENPESASAWDKQREALSATALKPAEVAEQVIDAIRAERFWILTHAGAKARVAARMESILEGRNPRIELGADADR